MRVDLVSLLIFERDGLAGFTQGLLFLLLAVLLPGDPARLRWTSACIARDWNMLDLQIIDMLLRCLAVDEAE